MKDIEGVVWNKILRKRRAIIWEEEGHDMANINQEAQIRRARRKSD